MVGKGNNNQLKVFIKEGDLKASKVFAMKAITVPCNSKVLQPTIV